MEKSVKLIECFDSFQGEGPDSGHAMIILRFKTCNRKCPWCDTAVKMRISMEAPYKLSDLQKRIKKSYSGLLITGGEPTVERHFDETVILLNELTYPIANVESNGYKLYDLVMAVNETKPVKFMNNLFWQLFPGGGVLGRAVGCSEACYVACKACCDAAQYVLFDAMCVYDIGWFLSHDSDELSQDV